MKTLATAALILGMMVPLVASGEDDLTSLSYISYLERYATIQPATDDEAIEAAINMPLVVGDRVDTAREARMEVILIRPSTILAAIDLHRLHQFSLWDCLVVRRMCFPLMKIAYSEKALILFCMAGMNVNRFSR